jgi:hypothetical protein
MRVQRLSLTREAGQPAIVAALALAVVLAVPSLLCAGQTPVAATATLVLGQAEFGTVKGRLVWGGDDVPPVKVLVAQGQAPKDPNVCARDKPIMSRELVVDPKTKGVAYAFAFISRPKGSNPEAVKELLARKPKVELDQVNCEFLPYLLPVHQDQTIVLKSSDATNHNVRLTPFTNPGMNQTLPPNGQLEVKLVAERLPIKVACDIHSWMHGWIMVFDHPFFTTTAADGSFELKGVPAGQQNLVLWQENVGYATPGGGRGIQVEVKPGAVAEVGQIVLDPAKVKPAG